MPVELPLSHIANIKMRGRWNGEQARGIYFHKLLFALPFLSLMGAETGVEPVMLQLMRLTRYRFSTLQYLEAILIELA